MAQQVDLLQRWGFDEIYQDTESGRHDDRVNFLRMLARARELAASGHTVEIRVARDDRWGRSITLVALVEDLEALGIKIYSKERGQISTATATEWKQTAWEALEAESYSRRLSDNVRRGYQYKRQQGQHLTGRAPWGYQIVDKRYAPDPAEWDKARSTIDLYLGGASFRQVSALIFEQYGKTWGVSSVRDWMLNPVLRGHTSYTVGGITNAERRRGISPSDKPKELRYNTHPAMISEAEYSEIVRRTQLNKQWGGRRNGRVFAINTLYIFCAICGKRCRTMGHWQRRYFSCQDRSCLNYPAPWARDRNVEAAIQNAIAEAAESVAAELNIESSDPRIPAWEAEIAALQAMAHRPAIAAEIEAIRAEIANAKAAQGNQAAGDAEYWEQVELLAKFTPEEWAAIPAEGRRQAYAYLVRRVLVEGSEVVEVELGRG